MKKIDHLSKSSIKEYLDCPFKFYQHQVKKIKGPTPFSFVKGGAIHDTLHEAIVKNKTVKEFPEQVQYVKAVLNKFQPWTLVVAEKRMSAKYLDMELVGLMDIVIKTDTDKIIILDYKSGKERPFIEYEFELSIYVYILQQNGIFPTHYGIIFTDQQSVIVKPFNQKKFDKAMAKAYQVWTEIQQGLFDRKIVRCSYCDLKDNCDILWYQYKEGQQQTLLDIK